MCEQGVKPLTPEQLTALESHFQEGVDVARIMIATVRDRERQLAEAHARVEKLRVYLLVFLDSVEDEPRAVQFFDLRVLREVKEYVAALSPAPSPPHHGDTEILDYILDRAHTLYLDGRTEGPIMVPTRRAVLTELDKRP